MRRGGLILCGLLSLVRISAAVEVQTWTQQSAADFEQGNAQGVVITSADRVELARQMSALVDLQVAHVWAMAREANGNLLAATGGPGLVVRVTPAGEVTKLHESKDQQIFALAVGPDGSIYYGSSPSGQIFRVAPNKEVEVFSETEETYIWNLAVGTDGAIFAATGPQGRLYHFTPAGEAEIRFEAKQQHLLSLAVGPDHMAYVGTSNDGIIYRVDPEGKGFVLHDAPQADVHALVLDAEGNLYAGTGTPDRPVLAPTTSGLYRWNLRPLRLVAALAMLAPPLAPVADAPLPAPAPGPSRPAPRPGLAASGENSVFRIARTGIVDEIFREKCLVLSLALQGDGLLVGTGQEGKLYRVDLASTRRQTLARLESGQAQSMIALSDETVIVGTGTPGALYRVEPRFAARGVLESSVFDARMQTRWGKANVGADVPAGASLSVEFRSGNVETADDTWSDWAADARTLPLARFLQYRAILQSAAGSATPSIGSVSALYATINRAPVVESIEVPDLATKPVTDGAQKIGVSWKGTDPNGDELIYDVDVRKEDWPDWVAVGRELASSEFKWDPGSMPSGNYRFRVTASDRPANRPDDSLSGSLVSDPFILDRDAPTVTLSLTRVQDRRFEMLAEGTDGQTRLTAAAYSLNGTDWWPLFPDDGLFDSPAETITFRTEPKEPGAYLIMVRFRDAAGRFGVADSVVTMPGE